MCGIFGYVGKKNTASSLILSGLKLLEYRGYDSWGIAVASEKGIVTQKEIGKIGHITLKMPKSNIGIGHTRWATHGGVTKANAHPHHDCNNEIAIIHNGIIENYLQIKESLLKKNHVFLSETDTEVVPHLIEEYISSGKSFVEAFRKACLECRGLNAIVAFSAKTNEIIAAKTGSPLIIGFGENEYFIASDASGIVGHTKKLIFMEDDQMVLLNDEILLFSLKDGKKKNLSIEEVDWKIDDVKKGQYPHFMIKEIIEQSAIIQNIATTYDDQIKDMAKLIDKAFGTFLIGAGTAYFATLAGTYLFSKIAHKHVNTAPASEFNYLEDFITKKSLIIALSQSGETIDVIEPLNRARDKGSTIASLVNVLGSSIYRMSDRKILLGVGPEKAVASTKAYTAKLSMLILLSYALVNNVKEGKKELLLAAKEIKKIMDNRSALDSLADKVKNTDHIYLVGRGKSYATALEGALKIKEVSYIHAEGMAGGELKHGPIALITKGTPCIVIAPDDETYDAIISNAMEIKARGGYIIGIAARKELVFDTWIPVKDCGNASVISHVVPLQYLAYALALAKNLDPDKPRNLAKSVTVK